MTMPKDSFGWGLNIELEDHSQIRVNTHEASAFSQFWGTGMVKF